MSSRSEALANPVAERDWGRLTGAATFEDFSAGWLAVAGTLLAADRGVLIARRGSSDRYSPVAFFPEGRPCGPSLADVAERALYDGSPLVVDDGPRLGIAYPVSARGRLDAIVAFEWDRAPDNPRESLLRMLQWGLPWIELRLGAGSAAGPDLGPTSAGVVQRTLLARGFTDAARAAATEIAHAFGCERASVGIVEGKRIRLAAISGNAHFDARLALPKLIEDLMAEALHGGTALERPAPEGVGRAFCVVAGECVFCLEHKSAMEAEARAAAESACAAVAPALFLQRASDMPLRQRAARDLRAHYRQWLGPAAARRRTTAGALLVLVAILVFARGEFRVAGDAVLEGSVRRVMTAPFDGYVSASSARAGDLVKQGAPIAALDDRDLRLERVRAASQQAQFVRQLQDSSAKHDRGQMQILQAQITQAEAQVQLLDEQLRRARMVAPFDGLIVSGDLSQSVGGAVRKGDTLFEVTPLTGYRVVVQVDESEISAVTPGQKGTLLLAAITGESFPVTVTVVTPVARAKEGRNAFRVEASLEQPSTRLRPGMEGVAKFDTGSRNLVWIWTHRFTNWLRLKLWSFWP